MRCSKRRYLRDLTYLAKIEQKLDQIDYLALLMPIYIPKVCFNSTTATFRLHDYDKTDEIVIDNIP